MAALGRLIHAFQPGLLRVQSREVCLSPNTKPNPGKASGPVSAKNGYGSKLNDRGTTGFSAWFFGYLRLPNAQKKPRPSRLASLDFRRKLLRTSISSFGDGLEWCFVDPVRGSTPGRRARCQKAHGLLCSRLPRPWQSQLTGCRSGLSRA